MRLEQGSTPAPHTPPVAMSAPAPLASSGAAFAAASTAPKGPPRIPSPACPLAPEIPQRGAPPLAAYWSAPLTACLRAALWGVGALWDISLSAAQRLGAWGQQLAAAAEALWPRAPAQAMPDAGRAPAAPQGLHDKTAQQRLGAQTLAQLRMRLATPSDAALSHAEREALLRAYYPVGKVIWALRHDAQLDAVRMRAAQNAPVPTDLLALRRDAFGLGSVGRSDDAADPWAADPMGHVCSLVRTRVRQRLQAMQMPPTSTRVSLQTPTLAGVMAWLQAAGVSGFTPALARRLSGGDVTYLSHAVVSAAQEAAAQTLLRAFAPHSPFDPANAAEVRAEALMRWAQPHSDANPYAILAVAAALPAGPEPFCFGYLEPAAAKGVVAVLTGHGHLHLSACLTALLAPDAWPGVCAALEALGFGPAQTRASYEAATTWAALPKGLRQFVLADVCAPMPVWVSFESRLGLAAQLHASTDTALLLGVLRAAQGLGRAQVARLATRAMAIGVAQGMLQADAARTQLEAWLEAGLYRRHELRAAAAGAGLHAAALAEVTARQVLTAEAQDDAGLEAFATALLWDPQAVRTCETLLRALHARLEGRAFPLDKLDVLPSAAPAGVIQQPKAGVPPAQDSVIVAGIRIDVALPHGALHAEPPEHVPLPQEKTFAACWRQGRSMLLEGPAGCGKTTLVTAMADRLGLPLHRLTLSPESDEQDLLGRYSPGPKGVPVWHDGLVVRAMRAGHIVLLDEANLSPPGLLERLNSVFDSRHLFVESTGERVVAHANFRCILAANPARYAGRHAFGEALRSRLRVVVCQALGADVLQPMLARAVEHTLPAALLSRLVTAHLHLMAALSSPPVSAASERITPRAIVSVVRRVRSLQAAQPASSSLEELAAREFIDIYTGLVGEDAAQVTEIAVRSVGSPCAIRLDAGLWADGDDWRLGDLSWPKHATPPDALTLILTPRTRLVLYRLLKALLCGESVALIGRRAGGKTALVAYAAALLGQPFVQQVLSAGTDVSTLIGAYSPEGWRDGALLALARPGRPPGLLLLDECNLAASSVLERLNAVLDDARTLTLPERDGESIRVQDDFRLVCAMNPPGVHNPGRGRLSSAFSSRLTWIEVGDAQSDEEDAIAVGLGQRLGLVHAVPLAAALRRFIDAALHRADRAQLTLRELCAAVHTFADLQAQMPVHAAFATALRAEYGAFLPDADEAAWERAAARAWPDVQR